MAHRDAQHRRVLRLFADILDYPTAGLAEKAQQCEELVSSAVPGAAPLIRAFRSFAEETPPGRLEEVYTGIFDLNPMWYPYVGYHLFGESYKRSTFLLALRERYRAQGFELGRPELADRLSVVLRFVAESGDEDERRELLVEGVIPALKRMTGKAATQAEPSAEPPVYSGPNTPELEGHAEGEVLAGGFLLEMSEGAVASGHARHAYRSALEATRLFLETAWPPRTAGQTVHAMGGKDDD